MTTKARSTFSHGYQRQNVRSSTPPTISNLNHSQPTPLLQHLIQFPIQNNLFLKNNNMFDKPPSTRQRPLPHLSSSVVKEDNFSRSSRFRPSQDLHSTRSFLRHRRQANSNRYCQHTTQLQPLITLPPPSHTHPQCMNNSISNRNNNPNNSSQHNRHRHPQSLINHKSPIPCLRHSSPRPALSPARLLRSQTFSAKLSTTLQRQPPTQP